MTSPFWNSIFGDSNCRTTNQMTFLEILTQNWKIICMFLKENFDFQNLFVFFLTELGLTLCQMLKWVSLSNSTFQMSHKTCVAPHLCYIFIRWPHLTWPWRWPVIHISVLFACHFRLPFNSILDKFRLAAIPGLASAVDKAEKSQLWPLTRPWLNIWPRKENISIALESPCWRLSIAASRSASWFGS